MPVWSMMNGFAKQGRKQDGGESRISSTLDTTLLQAPLPYTAPAFLKSSHQDPLPMGLSVTGGEMEFSA
ncbi:rap1 GTPase-activating protein 1 isoform X5 [Tachysurus ichikawai]